MGVALSAARFGKGQGVETPLSLIFFNFSQGLAKVHPKMCLDEPLPFFYGIFLCFLVYYHTRVAKGALYERH